VSSEDRITAYEVLEDVASGIRLQVTFQRRVNAAVLACQLPLVRAISVHNETGRDLEGVELTVDLTLKGAAARRVVYREERTLGAGSVVRFAGREHFAEFSAPINACRDATEAVLAIAARPARLEEDERDGGGGRWPSLSAAVEIGAADEFLDLPGLRHAIAAFVQPDSRAVAKLLKGAADFLRKKTGSGELEGYRAGFGRARLIAGAIYQAMRDAGIVCVEAPAPADGVARKVRGADDVLTGRSGAHIDLSVVYAACCEAAGLHPLVVIAATRAFPAFIAVSDLEYSLILGGGKGFEFLDEMVVDAPGVIARLIEAKAIVPVELGGLGRGKHALGFRTATKRAADYARDAVQELKAAVVIPQCRKERVFPLPESFMRDDASHGGGESSPPPAAPPTIESAAASPGRGDDAPESGARPDCASTAALPCQRDDAPARIRQWKQALFDFGPRNPLLDMARDGRALDLIVPDGMLGEIGEALRKGRKLDCASLGDAGFQIVENGLAGAVSPEFVQGRFVDEHRVFSGLDGVRHVERLRALKREAETLAQETGSWHLYLTLGVLVYPGPDGGEARAPLFMLPVKLTGGFGGDAWHFSLDGGDAAQPNPCLLEWLRRARGLALEALVGPDAGDSGGGIGPAFEKIRASLLEARLPCRIDETATLAILTLSSFHLWKDLDRNWPIFMENPVVRHLVERPEETFAQPALAGAPVDEGKLLLPLPADGSQMAAILAAAGGRSFVLDGAPGTGKSQTIANLIAHALETGRRVLFVAGKETAIEAVSRRLQTAGLGDFTLAVYGARVGMGDIRKQLKRSLRVAASDNEAAWTAALARHGDALAALRDYPGRVHAANAAGFSLWSAHDTLARLGEGPAWNLDPRFVGKIDVQGMADALAEAVHVIRQIGEPAHDPWLLVGLDDMDEITFTTLTHALTELGVARRKVDGLARGWLDAFRELKPGKYLAAMNECVAAAQAGLLPGKAHFQDIDRPGWRDAAAALRQRLASFLENNRDTLAALTPTLVDSPQLNDWIAAAERLARARIFAEFRRKPLRVAVAALVSPQTDLRGGGLLAVLRAAQEIRSQAAVLRSRANALAGLVLPADWGAHHPRALEKFDAAVHLSQLAVWLERHAPAAWLKVQEPRAASEIETLKEVEAAWMGWLAVVGATERSIGQWLGGRAWVEAWDSDAPRWADDIAGTGLRQLQRHARLRKALQAVDQAGGRDLADKLACKAFSPDEASAVMQRGLATASLRERLVASGLTNFDDGAQARTILAFQDSARELRRLAVSAGPARLLARRPFQADEAEGDAEALVREIERRRGGMGLREISARYPEALLSLTPAFLMSPGAVAHFLDAGSLKFDIVVFDEASRIRVPEAIGAMGRGKSVVIVGDQKQLPPGIVARADTTPAIADGRDEPVTEDLESILGEAVDAGLPRLRLAWHYRSENEDLIAFSNARYYESGLITLPPACRDAATGIVWRRVESEFSRGGERANRAEARAVVDEILARRRDLARRRESLGVVCFTARQRDLILDMLEASKDPSIRDALAEASGQRLFVKNVGDAQGEERDVILCSFAFSPAPGAGILPLDAGPLGNSGGERWLNVAITRARRQVVLFTSFDPAHIEPARAHSSGLLDLRRYLEFAAATSEIETAKSDGDEDRGGLVVEIARALEARGYLVRAGVGRSSFRVDLAVKKPGDEGWHLAIMVDGPAWQSRPTVADRDGAPALLRDAMKWPAVARVWLPGWLRSPEENLARLIERIEAPSRRRNATATAGNGASAAGFDGARKASSASAPASVNGAGSPVAIAGESVRESLIDFVPASDDVAAPQAVLNDLQTGRPEILRFAAEALATEGPVHLDRLLRIIANRFGYPNVGFQKRAELSSVITDTFAVDEDGFVWQDGVDCRTWRTVRRTVSGSDRAMAEICPAELLNAMELVLARAHAARRDDLLRDAASVLGYARLTERARKNLALALERGLAQGRLLESGGSVRIGRDDALRTIVTGSARVPVV
jgi:hypothetical protein